MFQRRSIRLKDYDYAQEGVYFVTICTYQRNYLFGEIIDGEMIGNRWGEIVMEEWEITASLRPNVELDAFVVMPNHVHGIVVITDSTHASMIGVGAQRAAPLPVSTSQPHGITPNNVISGSLGAIVRGFKSSVTRRIHQTLDGQKTSIWQRNYYEHIILSEKRLNEVRAYIETNPSRWEKDSLFGR